MFSKETYISRRQELKKLVKSGVIILFGNNNSPCNFPNNGYYPFRQDSTFLYYFGLQRDGLRKCLCSSFSIASSACFSVKGFPSILFDAYELFFLEFFRSLLAVACGSFASLIEKRFSSIAEILFSISFESETLIILPPPLLILYLYFTKQI